MLLAFGMQCAAQSEDSKKYVAYVRPSDATYVYGMLFTVFPKENASWYPKVYGMEIELNPIGVFAPFVAALNSIDSEVRQPPTQAEYEIFTQSASKKIYGIQMGLLNMEPTIVDGIAINATGSFGSRVNGMSIAGAMNKHFEIYGLAIAPIGNFDVKCRGIQIGLFNTCNDLKGIQIGLWNKNQKRSLPLINWNFSD